MIEALIRNTGIGVTDNVALTDVQAAQDIQVKWKASLPTAELRLLGEQAKVSGTLQTARRQLAAGRLVRQRGPELSSTQLLVVAVDKDKQLRWWQLQPDPRLLRAEFPRTDGTLTGESFYMEDTEFNLSFPADPIIRALHLYHPHWNGREFELELVGTIAVE